MIKVHLPIEENLVEQLEDALYEITPHNWVLHFRHSKSTSFLEGYFDNSLDAEESLKELFYTLEIIEIPELLISELDQEDWVNSYKKHFHPWSIGTFHWVPIWCKKSYIIPRITLGYSLIQVWPLVQGIMRLQNCAWKKL